MSTVTKLKVRLASWMCHPSVGRLIELAAGGSVRSRGVEIGVGPEVTPSTCAALFWGLYESGEIRFVQRWLPSTLDVIELGSSLGVVSSHVARRLEPGRRLLCVEANPRLIEAIRRNVCRNAPHVALEVVHAAVSYSRVGGTLRFQVASRNIDSRVLADGLVNEGCMEVPSIRLNDILERHGFGDYALVSDIEGAEAGILEHDADALRRCKMAIIELHASPEASISTMRNRLEALGFSARESHGPVYVFERVG